MYNEEVTKYIEAQIPENQILLNQLRDLIHELIPEIQEKLKWRYPSYSYKKDLFYLRGNKAHVTFGLYDYEMVPEFEQVLEGEGKKLRHLKVTSFPEEQKLLVEKLIGSIYQYVLKI